MNANNKTLIAVVMILFMVSGCFAPPEQNDDMDETPVAPGPMTIHHDITGCDEILLIALVQPEHARNLLPPGFEPADAATFFGSPVPAGQAMVSINAIGCSGSSLEGGPAGFAQLIVIVEPPDVEGIDVETAERHAYLLQDYTTSAAFINATRETGVDLSMMDIEVEMEHTPTGGLQGTGVLMDDDGERVRIEITGAPALTDASSSILYQVTQTGLAVQSFAWDSAPLSAGTASCSIRPGSLAAEALGAENCDDANVVGLLFGTADFEASFRHVPGAGVG